MMIPNDMDLTNGGVATDDRGVLKYVNQVPPEFEQVQRFYQVENFAPRFVRAWHGHRVESKFVWVTKGSVFISYVSMDVNLEEYDEDDFTVVVLSSNLPRLLHIPSNNYNGFMTLEEDTRIMFFSTSTLSESASDDHRLDAYAFESVIDWEVKER